MNGILSLTILRWKKNSVSQGNKTIPSFINPKRHAPLRVLTNCNARKHGRHHTESSGGACKTIDWGNSMTPVLSSNLLCDKLVDESRSVPHRLDLLSAWFIHADLECLLKPHHNFDLCHIAILGRIQTNKLWIVTHRATRLHIMAIKGALLPNPRKIMLLHKCCRLSMNT